MNASFYVKIQAFAAKHFTKLFVKLKNDVWIFVQAGVFRIVAKNVSTNLLDLSWMCVQFATHILPDMETRLIQLRCATSA